VSIISGPNTAISALKSSVIGNCFRIVSDGFPFMKKKIDRLKVRELYDKGKQVTEIANKLGVSKGAISKVLKQMGLAVAKVAVIEAPKYEKKQDAATEHLLFLADKARKELEWIERTVPPKNDADYRAWQDQKLKFAAEMRKLITAMADIGYKLYQAKETSEILQIILEEIGHESQDCQKRIYARIRGKRDIRFPVDLNC
jgi:DNA-binding MarR family transcriptional regulator